MSVTQIISGALRDVTARWRTARTIRRAVLLLAVIGTMAGVAVATAGPSLADVGSQPGNLILRPGSGAASLTPTWSTTDGCPAGYRGSAVISMLTPHGRFISLISSTAYGLTKAFGGTLDGSMAALLHFAHVKNGGTLEFAVGCYTQVGGTGHYTYIQSTIVTLSSSGTSYTTSSPSASSSSSTGQQGYTSGSAGSGQQTTTRAPGALAADTSGMGSTGEAALIAGLCVLAIAASAFVWHRRRDRSRLM